MGFLEKESGLVLWGTTPPGTCPECGVAHDPGQPHDRGSLYYQYRFYDMHGRWPTWKDAMEHCAPEVKELWINALMKHGIKVEE